MKLSRSRQLSAAGSIWSTTIFVSIAAVPLSADAGDNGPRVLSGQEIAVTHVGHTLIGADPAGSGWTIALGREGSAHAMGTSFRSVGLRDDGTFIIEHDRLCFTWQHLGQGRTRCVTVSTDGRLFFLNSEEDGEELRYVIASAHEATRP